MCSGARGRGEHGAMPSALRAPGPHGHNTTGATPGKEVGAMPTEPQEPTHTVHVVTTVTAPGETRPQLVAETEVKLTAESDAVAAVAALSEASPQIARKLDITPEQILRHFTGKLLDLGEMLGNG